MCIIVKCVKCGRTCLVNILLPRLLLSQLPLFSMIRKVFGIQKFDTSQFVCYSEECKEKFEKNEMEADHITPWHEGGKSDDDNCQMLCKKCNRTLGGK